MAALPACSRAGPVLRCGHCLKPTPQSSGDPNLYCHSCGRRNALPSHVWVTCARCQLEQRVQTRQLGIERRCPACGQVLPMNELVLTPLLRRRHTVRTRRRTPQSFGSPREYAAVMLLFFATAALTVLMLLTQR